MDNKYFSKQDPTDFSIQSEDGGGLVFSKDAKYIFGAKQDDITKQLNEDGYEGNVDVNPNTNSSFIAIMNENSTPIEVNIPNTNQYSIFEPQQNDIVQPDSPPTVDCANEFNDIASTLLKTNALYNYNFNVYYEFSDTDQDIVDNISKINPKKFQKAKKTLLDVYWNNNRQLTLNFASLNSENKAQIVPNPDKFIIKNLPPGLRDLLLFELFQKDFNPYIYFPLVFGPDGIDLKDSNFNSLGVPFELYNQSFYDDKYLQKNSKYKYKTLIADTDGNLTDKEIYRSIATNVPPGAKIEKSYNELFKLYIENFDKYFEYYNLNSLNKRQVLETFKKVMIRDYTNVYKIDRVQYATDKKEIDSINKYYEQDIKIFNKIYDIALKYVDCPLDNQAVFKTPPPTPSLSPSTPLTAKEIEEGIYEANFLPAVETTGSQIFEDIIPVTDITVVDFFSDPKNENYYNDNKPSTLTYDTSGKGKATNAKEYYGDGAPYINQKTNWACLATSLVMLEQYAGKTDITEETFIRFSTNPPAFSKANTAKGPYIGTGNNFNFYKFYPYVGNVGRVGGNIDRKTAFDRYKQKLTETKKPVVIRIAGTINRSRGHFVLAVGIAENGNIIIHNPASTKVAFKDTELSVEGLLNSGEQSTGYNYDIIYLTK